MGTGRKIPRRSNGLAWSVRRRSARWRRPSGGAGKPIARPGLGPTKADSALEVRRMAGYSGSMYEYLVSTREGSLAIVTLNRPERRNALSLQMMQELIACLDGIAEDKNVRAVILAAAGKVFSSGHDLNELVNGSIAEYREIFDVCTQLMTKVQSIPQPVIAEVQGIATAAGCQLAATCDLAVASESARFGTPGVRIGLFCSTPMVALSRAIGRKRALEMLLTGELIDARTAADWGLVNRVVAAGSLRAESLRIATRIAEASPLTVAIGKQ